MLDTINYLVAEQVDLSQLYLDPNNPRFQERDLPEVPLDDITDSEIQQQTIRTLDKLYGLSNLVDSILENGFLPIDRIVIQELEESTPEDKKYVVLEGNRRIASAKKIAEKISLEEETPEEFVSQSLESIPVLIYTGTDSDAAWIFQGLRHISGIKDWSAANKAKLLVSQMNKTGASYSEVGKTFGISSYASAQMARAYYAFEQAKNETVFRDDIDSRAYPYLQELFGRSDIALKNWMDWDDENRKFINVEIFEEYLNWLYPKEDESGEYDPELAGNWENKRLNNVHDQRILTKAITEFPKIFDAFRNGSPISLIQLRMSQENEREIKNTDYYLDLFKEFTDTLNDIPLIKILEEGRKGELSDSLDSVQVKINSIKNILN